MASAVDIANLALSLLGADPLVTSLDPPDRQVLAQRAAQFWPLARREALAGPYSFACARRRATLAEVVNDSAEFAYAYRVPSDCIRPRHVLNNDATDGAETGRAVFRVEGSTLYTQQAEAVLVYSVDVPDPATYPPDLVTALGMALAGYLAGAIVKGEKGTRLAAAWADRAMDALMRAAVNDANASHDTAEFKPASLRARA